MHRVSILFGAICVAMLGGSLSAQTPAVTSSVFAPESLTCSAAFNSSVTLHGSDRELPGTADIVIVMDESGSIDTTEFQQVDQFFDSVIELLDLAGSNNRVAVVKYSSFPRLVTPFSQDAAALKAMGRTFPGGSTATAQAIQMAREHMLSQARAGSSRFIIVLTDGFCTCTLPDLQTQANASNAAGITTVAVGVDAANITELEVIASDIPGVDTSLFVSNFNELGEMVGALTEAIVTPAANDVIVVVDAMPRFPVDGASASAGSVAVAGSQITWTLPALGAGSQTLTINHHHDGTGNGPLQVFSAAYTDAENHSVPIDVPSTTVSGCNVAPVANAGADQTVPVAGAAAAVTLNGSGSIDDGLIDPLIYAWSSDTGFAASGVSPVVSLPLGVHTFTLIVNDGEFSNADTVVITVTDTTPPVIAGVTPSTGMLWPPNHKMVPVTLAVSAGDNAGGAPACAVTGVTSNEGDASDAEITGPLTLNLRAERAGSGTGRVYAITVTCTDGSGNSSTDTVTVTAPKSQGKGK